LKVPVKIVEGTGVTQMSSKAYNIIAAVACTLAAILAIVALFDTAPTDARFFGIGAAGLGVISGIAWTVAAVKG
jgi:hypothetical protein